MILTTYVWPIDDKRTSWVSDLSKCRWWWWCCCPSRSWTSPAAAHHFTIFLKYFFLNLDFCITTVCLELYLPKQQQQTQQKWWPRRWWCWWFRRWDDNLLHMFGHLINESMNESESDHSFHLPTAVYLGRQLDKSHKEEEDLHENIASFVFSYWFGSFWFEGERGGFIWNY